MRYSTYLIVHIYKRSSISLIFGKCEYLARKTVINRVEPHCDEPLAHHVIDIQCRDCNLVSTSAFILLLRFLENNTSCIMYVALIQRMKEGSLIVRNAMKSAGLIISTWCYASHGFQAHEVCHAGKCLLAALGHHAGDVRSWRSFGEPRE